jgi:hypothetical protein
MKNFVFIAFCFLPLFSVSQTQVVLKSGRIVNAKVVSFLSENLILDEKIEYLGSDQINIFDVIQLNGATPAYRKKAILKKNPDIKFGNLIADTSLPQIDTKAIPPRMIHLYNGIVRPTNELVFIKVIPPIKIFFVNDVPIRVNGDEIIALLPGTYKIIAGYPIKTNSGNEFADNVASTLSENKEITINGNSGDYFKLVAEDNGLINVSITVNGRTFQIPKTYSAKLDTVKDNYEASFFKGISSTTTIPLTTPFLENPENLKDNLELQGNWKVIGINLKGKVYTVEEYKKIARNKDGDTTMLNITFKINGLRIKWTGDKLKGETV